jgi:cephalosporin hydroxylase
VFDTVIEHRNGVEFADRPFGKGDNPKTASAEFKKVNSNFVDERSLGNKLLISKAPRECLNYNKT